MLALLVCLLAPAFASEQAVVPTQKIPLFNGRNLDGWYTWLRDFGYQDPERVFRVENNMLRITGTHWGGLATRQAYRDYHLIVEWKWGGPTHGERKDRARDSGILVHAVGEDGAYRNTWLESIESQIIEGGSGDFILVGGKNQPRMTANVRMSPNGEAYWDKNGMPLTKDRGRFNWWGRDPDWKDVINFRGKQDIEKPLGQWNRQEVICDGARITNILNGVVMAEGYDLSHQEGKIQLQSEGAEIWFRKVELHPLKPTRQRK
ncbi:MAG: DUF1080 domain-containing protein [Bryobacteraceae bacterium]|nr:DUF1080 domain-containing protein [Bryobacteraceae bacterium]MDW8379240.1 DUF1080 domain-containing protein [Bryobacterales bacterium]